MGRAGARAVERATAVLGFPHARLASRRATSPPRIRLERVTIRRPRASCMVERQMTPSVDYEALVHEHRAHLWALAYRITGTASEADDVVQETFRRAIEHPPTDVARPWRPWLARVATNVAVDTLRRRMRDRYVGPWLPEPVVAGSDRDRRAR